MIGKECFKDTLHLVRVGQRRESIIEYEYIVLLLHILEVYFRAVTVHHVVGFFDAGLFRIVNLPVYEVPQHSLGRQCRIINPYAIHINIGIITADYNAILLGEVIVVLVGKLPVLHPIDINDTEVEIRIPVSVRHDNESKT